VNAKLLDFYRRQWPRVAAVQAKALGGAGLGVAAPNVLLADRNSPHAFTAHQMGPYSTGTSEEPATTAPEASG
jgi:hypothetical protein